MIFITTPFHLGDFGKTKEPEESPITTKIPAFLNDSTSTGKIIRRILFELLKSEYNMGISMFKNVLNIFDNRSNN